MPQIITRAGKGSALTHNELDANFSRTVRAVTGTDSVVASDNRNLIECNHASTPFTVTMITVALAAAEDTDGFETTFFNIGAAVASIDADGTETINGSTAAITLKQYDGVTLKLNSAGTGWDTISRVGDLGDIDAGTINAGATTVTTFTSTGIDDNATGERLQINDSGAQWGATGISYTISHVANDRSIYLAGGNAVSTSAYIRMYGSDHSSGGDMDFCAPGNNQWMLWDESLGKWKVSTGIGAKTEALAIDASQNATFAGTISATGDVTGATVAATGDASAGDNSVLAYQANAGAVVQGQGLVYDVTLRNDTGSAALGVPTGTTNVDVVGDMTATGNISGAEVQVAGTDIFETIYPIGTIYQSTASTNPATLFGVGTWTALEDRFLIGESATYAAASTGGSADAIVVEHNHTVGYSTSSGNDAIVQSGAAGQNGTVNTSTAGSSATGANMPPYLVVYMWERTA